MLTKIDNIIDIDDLKNAFADQVVHEHLNLTIKRGEIVAIIGGSGCGKTTLLRSILRLQKPTSGTIQVFGQDVWHSSTKIIQAIRRRWGVMFQGGALFSSLSLIENITFPMEELADIDIARQKEIALLKMKMVGLDAEHANKYPAQLSGGMIKRAALARALALDPELVFLDEPTSGLDPKSAGAFDQLILAMRKTLGITFVMITHDLDSLWLVPDRVLFLGERKVLAAEPMSALMKNTAPAIKDYLSGVRAYDRSILMKEGKGGFEG